MKLIHEQIRRSLMLDFYKRLLTKKEQHIADLYFNHDLGLSEIAKKIKVSRQAIYFSLKNIIKDLEKYENRLKLYQTYMRQKRLKGKKG